MQEVQWEIPYVTYDFDIDSDAYTLSRIENLIQVERVPLLLRQSNIRLVKLENEQLQKSLLEAPFLILRGRGNKIYAASGRDNNRMPQGVRSKDYHVESSIAMLHYHSSISRYSWNHQDNNQALNLRFDGSCKLLCDILCVPLKLRANEVPFILAQRRISIGKQLRDRRIVLQSTRVEGGMSSYDLSTLRMVRGFEVKLCT